MSTTPRPTPETAPEPRPELLPATGGSYTRQPDGSLQPADAPAADITKD